MDAFGPLVSLAQTAYVKMHSGAASEYFTDERLHRIADTIQEVEQLTSVEIRVSIHHQFSPGINDVHAQAAHDFEVLGMHHTRHHTGILIVFALEKRAFKIMVDPESPILERFSQEYWDNVRSTVVADYREFTDGICKTIQLIGRLLTHDFPRTQGERPELPSKVIFD